MERIIIYPKDIVQITGKSERWARYCIGKIKEGKNKLPGQLVTFEEFYDFIGVSKKI